MNEAELQSISSNMDQHFRSSSAGRCGLAVIETKGPIREGHSPQPCAT